jgi:hypothetical protein
MEKNKMIDITRTSKTAKELKETMLAVLEIQSQNKDMLTWMLPNEMIEKVQEFVKSFAVEETEE